jgi:transposase
MQTKLRTYEIIPNDNICFPIGTILAVENLYRELNLSSILGKHTRKGIEFNSLTPICVSRLCSTKKSTVFASKPMNIINQRAESIMVQKSA